MSKIRRSVVILASATALATGAVILTTHAADQGRKPPAPGAPQVPEESATIRDDPTIAPDPKQSADNSVSFPNDT
jgi:hypothetical protein